MYPVAVHNGRNKTFWCAPRLRFYGLQREKDDRYVGEVTGRTYEKLKNYCKRKGLIFHTNNEYGERSSDYRRTFFQNNKPIVQNCYFCAYCGKLLSKKKVTVDHLFPVSKVSRDIRLQKKMARMGIYGLNEKKNLVAACMKCNRRKGTHMGKWIIKGRIGRHAWVWMIRWGIRATLLFWVIWIFFHPEMLQKIIRTAYQIMSILLKGAGFK